MKGYLIDSNYDKTFSEVVTLLGALRAQLNYLEDTIDFNQGSDWLNQAYLRGMASSLLNAYREVEIIESKGE